MILEEVLKKHNITKNLSISFNIENKNPMIDISYDGDFLRLTRYEINQINIIIEQEMYLKEKNRESTDNIK